MDIQEKYMRRCLQLAVNGKGFVSPNPMVGAVIVHEGKIIGEGFHREYGKAHAEVNTIGNVKDKSALKNSTMYVSLEPCSHYGKTPPCSQLIISHGIPRVVIATHDPNPKVSGNGIKLLQESGTEVSLGLLEKEAQMLNKSFFCKYTKNRPYIYLKWAQTNDGFIDKVRTGNETPHPVLISNNLTHILVHKLRAEVSAIMVGTNTAINDNPSLTTRYWYGKNPIRIILDRNRRIPESFNIFDNNERTIVFTENLTEKTNPGKVEFIPIAFDSQLPENLLSVLNNMDIQSVLIEGGQQLLQSFIDAKLWDEAIIEISGENFGKGLPAPVISGKINEEYYIKNSLLKHLIPPE